MKLYKSIDRFKEYNDEIHKTTKHVRTYVAYNKIQGLYKIGKSKNIPKRINQINYEHGETILFAVINVDIEVDLHRLFNDKLIHVKNEREWFNLNDFDLKTIKLISSIVRNNIFSFLKPL
jgi:hypothetical protein